MARASGACPGVQGWLNTYLKIIRHNKPTEENHDISSTDPEKLTKFNTHL